jgi:hypothetical protein
VFWGTVPNGWNNVISADQGRTLQFSHWDSATQKCRNKEKINSNPTHDGGPCGAWVSITNNYLDTLVSKLTKWVCISLNKEIYPPHPLPLSSPSPKSKKAYPDLSLKKHKEALEQRFNLPF